MGIITCTHRLVTALTQIKDAQPRVAQTYKAVTIPDAFITTVVGTAVTE